MNRNAHRNQQVLKGQGTFTHRMLLLWKFSTE